MKITKYNVFPLAGVLSALIILALIDNAVGFRGDPEVIIYGAGTAGCIIIGEIVPFKKTLVITNGDYWQNTSYVSLPFNYYIDNVAIDFARPLRLQKSEEKLRNSLGLLRTSDVVFPDLPGGAGALNGGVCHKTDNGDFDVDMPMFGVDWNSTYINSLVDPKFTYHLANGTIIGNGSFHLTQVSPESILKSLQDSVTQTAGTIYNPQFENGNLTGSGIFFRPMRIFNNSGTLDFVRQDTYEIYVKPLLNHPNLEFIDHANVDSISSSHKCKADKGDSKCVDCVHYSRFGKKYKSCVKKNGVLIDSTGYGRSFEILAHSGIGDCAQLQAETGIDCFFNAPTLGKTLKEQIYVGFSAINFFPSPDWEQHIGSIVGTNLRLNTTYPLPNVEIAMASQRVPFAAAPLGFVQAFTILAIVTKPASVGYIKLQERDWEAPYNISYGLFDNPQDRVVLGSAVRVVLQSIQKLQTTNPFFALLSPSEAALPRNPTTIQLDNFLNDNVDGEYHTVSTVPMGSPEKGGVLDSNLKFRGISNLFVCHQGSRPSTYSSHNTHYGVFSIAMMCVTKVLEYLNC